MATALATDIKLLPVGRLKVDHRYQRKLDEAWVDRLSDRWRPEMAGVLLVSNRKDGDLVVLDGQHRLAAVRKLLADRENVDQSLWSEVYYGLSLEEEAAIFMGRNTQRAVHIIDRFRARVVAGEPVAKTIDDTLKAHDSRWDYNSDKGYACVGLLEKIHGWGVLQSTVRVLEEAWPNGEYATSKHKRQFVEGMGIFVLRAQGQPGYSEEVAISRLSQRINPAGVLRNARNRSVDTSVNQSVVVARDLRDAYNRNAKHRLREIIPPKGYRG